MAHSRWVYQRKQVQHLRIVHVQGGAISSCPSMVESYPWGVFIGLHTLSRLLDRNKLVFESTSLQEPVYSKGCRWFGAGAQPLTASAILPWTVLGIWWCSKQISPLSSLMRGDRHSTKKPINIGYSCVHCHAEDVQGTCIMGSLTSSWNEVYFKFQIKEILGFIEYFISRL